MATTTSSSVVPVTPTEQSPWTTAADLQGHLGGIPVERIMLIPTPGQATERELLAISRDRNRTLELIDGILVEKTVGFWESRIAAMLLHMIHSYLDQHKLGIATGEGGTIRLLPRQVRAPDVAFFATSSLEGKDLSEPVPSLVPDLAVEVLSKSNTHAEMDRKLNEYFSAGTKLVWYIDPTAKTTRVYHDAGSFSLVTCNEDLLGEDVLPGFRLKLGELFERVEAGLPGSAE